MRDAYEAAEWHFPADVDPIHVMRTPELITDYRVNAAHVYNEFGLSAPLWALAHLSNLIHRELMLKDPGL
jgi:hypothetical protein